MDNKKIGKNIKKYREAKGLNQEELAFTIKRSQGYIALLESGKRNIDAEILYNISVELGTPVSAFYEEVQVHKTPQEQEMLDILKTNKIDSADILSFVLKDWKNLKDSEGDFVLEAIKMVVDKVKGKKKLK
ncbi:XRE family transcriptional regulator [Candidatus Magnetobacterium bavaricum]|uniref:XRE family transcriptional regulator n=1 Tax=Candidatus Magnetobacterium bavaricum TaxID=29290 RepID=A0A0F3GP60_9BACT|nr:XRE family transcriptional regulator [Candidatus Magnetobacterium bavaricum]